MKTLTASSSAQGTIIDPVSTDVTATTDAAEDKPVVLLSDAEVNSYLDTYVCTYVVWSILHNIQKFSQYLVAKLMDFTLMTLTYMQTQYNIM